VVEYNPIFAALIVEAAARERAKLGCYRPAGGDGVYCVRRQNAKPGVVVDVLRGVRGGDGAGVSAVACRGSHEIAVSSACRATGRQHATRENCASQAVRSPGAINVDGPSAARPRRRAAFGTRGYTACCWRDGTGSDNAPATAA